LKSHLAILLWATSPDTPHLCATPFADAAAAAAMDVAVEVHFSSRSVLLLTEGVAAKLYPGSDPTMSVYDYMQQAARLGAKFLACSDAFAANTVDKAALIPEFAGFAGAGAFVGRALDPEWTVLVF
jgi:uncharacterized protein